MNREQIKYEGITGEQMSYFLGGFKIEKTGLNITAYRTDSSIRLNIIEKKNGRFSLDKIDIGQDNFTSNLVKHSLRLSGNTNVGIIKDEIEGHMDEIPFLTETRSIGIHKDADGNITDYAGTKCYNGRGDEIINGTFAVLTQSHGRQAVEGCVDTINEYMAKNTKRQAVIANALSATLCGVTGRKAMLAVVGDSGTKNDIICKLGVSLYTQPDDRRATLNVFNFGNIKKMGVPCGVNILIADTNPDRLKSYDNIIEKMGHISTSLTVCLEKPLLTKINSKRELSRYIELDVWGSELFDDRRETKKIRELINKNSGLIGAEFTQYILSNYTKCALDDYIGKVSDELIEKYSECVNGNDTLERQIDGNIGIILATARLANEFMGFGFDIDKLSDMLIDNCNENTEDFSEITTAFNVYTAYSEIVLQLKQAIPEYVDKKNQKIRVKSPVMKNIIDKYVKEYGMKPSEIKRMLASKGFLGISKKGYSKSHTYKKENFNGYEIILKGEMAA